MVHWLQYFLVHLVLHFELYLLESPLNLFLVHRPSFLRNLRIVIGLRVIIDALPKHWLVHFYIYFIINFLRYDLLINFLYFKNII